MGCKIVKRGEQPSRECKVCIYYLCSQGRGRCELEYVFHELDITGHKDCFESWVKTEKGNLSEGVSEKYTSLGFRMEFVGRLGTQLRKA